MIIFAGLDQGNNWHAIDTSMEQPQGKKGGRDRPDPVCSSRPPTSDILQNGLAFCEPGEAEGEDRQRFKPEDDRIKVLHPCGDIR